MDQFTFLQSVVSSSEMETVLFYLISSIAIIFSVGVIFDPKIIRSGFLLIGVFGAISGLFLLLQAQFIAMAQIMIYAVGITLVVVIALMLTNPRLERDAMIEEAEIEQEPGPLKLFDQLRSLLPMLVGALMLLTIHLAVRPEQWTVKGESVGMDALETIGSALTTVYSLPFEFASVLLLAALIGSIMLAKAEPRKKKELPESSISASAETR